MDDDRLCIGLRVAARLFEPEALAKARANYVIPADAGPEWRVADALGCDMAALEYTLNLTPEQRLEEHTFALNMALEMKAPDRRPNGWFFFSEASQSNLRRYLH